MSFRDTLNRAGCRPRIESLEDRCMLAVSIVDLGTFGGNISHGYAINAAGQVAGDAEGDDGPKKNHPFLYSNGSKVQLPTPGFDYGVARAMNNRGQVVGFMYTLEGTPIHHAFAYQNGVTTDLGTLGGKGSQAYGNNDRGQVIGLADTVDEVGHAFLYTRGKMIDLGSLGGESFAYDINNKAQVVGYYFNEQGHKRSFLWQKGFNYDLGDFGGDWSDAWAINESGQVAGYAFTAEEKEHAYLWQPDSPNSTTGHLIDLGLLPTAQESFAYNMNNKGQVVGASQLANGQFHAFVWQDVNKNNQSDPGEMIDLNQYLPPNSEWNFLNYAMAINDNGSITGYGFKKDNSLHAFLMTFTEEGRTIRVSDRVSLVRPTRAAESTPMADVTFNSPSAVEARPAQVSDAEVESSSKNATVQTARPQQAAKLDTAADSLFVSPVNITDLLT